MLCICWARQKWKKKLSVHLFSVFIFTWNRWKSENNLVIGHQYFAFGCDDGIQIKKIKCFAYAHFTQIWPYIWFKVMRNFCYLLFLLLFSSRANKSVKRDLDNWYRISKVSLIFMSMNMWFSVHLTHFIAIFRHAQNQSNQHVARR